MVSTFQGKLNMPDKIPDTILDMLRAADTDAAVFPPTILYNDGWTLRIVLSAGTDGVSCLPFLFLPQKKSRRKCFERPLKITQID